MRLVVDHVVIHVWLLVKVAQDNVHHHAVDVLVAVEDVKVVQVVVVAVVLVHVNLHVLLHVIQIALLVVTVH